MLPVWGVGSVDQMVADLICFNAGTFIGRIITDVLDPVITPNPYGSDDPPFSSTIDIYECDLPIGKTLLLRIIAVCPDQKRQIGEFAREITNIAQSLNVRELFLIRSASSILCLESQIKNWPRAIRITGNLSDKLDIPLMEQYGDSRENIRKATFGDVYTCIKSSSTKPVTMAFVFAGRAHTIAGALHLAQKLTAKEQLQIPPSWEFLNEH